MIVNNILRSVYRASEDEVPKLNLLAICRNTEKYISLLCNLGHNVFVLKDHPWNSLIEQKHPSLQTLGSVDYLDFIICFDRAEQYSEAQHIAHQLHIPIVLVDTCSEAIIRPHHWMENLKPRDPTLLHKNPALRICTNKHVDDSWNDSPSVVIHTGIDTNKFKDEVDTEDQLLVSIDNNIPAQLGAEIARRIPHHVILPTDHEKPDMKTVNRTRYFINTKRNITIKTLEAMAAGNVVICISSKDTKDYFNRYHKKTGALIDSADGLLPAIEYLEANPEIRNQICQSARERIIEENDMGRFKEQWINAFNIIKQTFYIQDV